MSSGGSSSEDRSVSPRSSPTQRSSVDPELPTSQIIVAFICRTLGLFLIGRAGSPSLEAISLLFFFADSSGHRNQD